MRVWVLIVSWGMVLRSKVGERGGELGVIVDVILTVVPVEIGVWVVQRLQDRMSWYFYMVDRLMEHVRALLSVVTKMDENVGVSYAMSSAPMWGNGTLLARAVSIVVGLH
jgi:hypothetical protein